MLKLFKVLFSLLIMVGSSYAIYHYFNYAPKDGDAVVVLVLDIVMLLVGVFSLVFALFPVAVVNFMYGKDRRFF